MLSIIDILSFIIIFIRNVNIDRQNEATNDKHGSTTGFFRHRSVCQALHNRLNVRGLFHISYRVGDDLRFLHVVRHLFSLLTASHLRHG